MLDLISLLYAYNTWANGRILDTTAQLTPDQFVAKAGASFDSVRDTLVHTMSAQWMWLSRWQGTSPRSMLNPADYPDLETLRQRWVQIESDTQAFLASLDEATLKQVVEYTNTRGQPHVHVLWHLMLHQVNHATQHRSEVAVMLTQFGHSPGGLDLIFFLGS